LIKTLRSPFENLRANGRAVEMDGDIPFVLRSSKHETQFFAY
jgi:hypothetical protein